MSRIPLACALGALLFLPACQESEAATHAGKYALDAIPTAKAVMKGMGMPGEPTQEQIDQLAKGMQGTLELKADLSFSFEMKMSMMGMDSTSTAKGTWTIKDGKISMTGTHEDGKEIAKDKQETAEGTIKDGVLVASMKKEGKAMELTFKMAK